VIFTRDIQQIKAGQIYNWVNEMVLIVALKPPLILLSGGVWKGGKGYNPLNHLRVKKRKNDVNVVGRVRQSYFRVHICSGQGCINCAILLCGIRARGVSFEHMENMEMFSCSPT